jgi:hypothetical protein
MRVIVSAGLTVFALLAGGGCSSGDGSSVVLPTPDGNTDEADAGESASPPDAGGETCPPASACAASCCAAGERCWRETCIPDNGTCAGDDDCINDTWCSEGVCVPYGTGDREDRNPDCRTEPVPLDRFDAEIQCEWPGPDVTGLEMPDSTNVRIPPLIGDLDADGIPEIVFSTCSASTDNAVVRAIRGDDCSTRWTSAIRLSSNQDLALGDLDGDGDMEVCGRAGANAFCLDHEGALIWSGHHADGTEAVIEPGLNQVGVEIADVDGIAPPELVVGLSVFDAATGLLALRGPDVGAMSSHRGIIPAVADIDGDGHLEALSGASVLDLVDGHADAWETSPGYTAVAELVAAAEGPEIVVVVPGENRIRVQSLDGSILWESSIPGGSGGPPTVADLDGDGRAEFSAAGERYLTAYDLDCTGSAPDPAFCADPDDGDGIIWSVETHEYSSGNTGSAVFDFEGDGPVEVVYADECWIRVFDGKTGEVKFSAPHLSGTGTEYATIGDVDGDFYTEIVVPHEYYSAGCPDEDPLNPGVLRDPDRRYEGVTIYRDVDDRWAPSRPLWSQHAEHYSDRNDDGTVPSPEPPSWLSHNSYRQTFASWTALDRPDLTVQAVSAPACDVDEAVQPLGAFVCNRGTMPVAAGVAVAFVLDGPGGETICETTTAEDLMPGDCTEVSCLWTGVPIDEPHDVWCVVDGVGEAAGAITECLERNNLGTATGVRCPPDVV